MRKLVILALVVFAGWTAWKKYPTLFERQPKNDAVIENASDQPVQRVRLVVGNQTLVKESITPGQSVTLSFAVNHDTPIRLEWELPDGSQHNWSKGLATAGPMLEVHDIRIESGDRVIYDKRPKPEPEKH